MATTGQSRRRVQSIEVGFRVLRVLRMADGLLPLREIAVRANMPPSKVHLYLVSFIRENMAYQDAETGFYGLGSFAIQLGLAAVRQVAVVTAAADFLPALRDETDCAIYLSLWGDSGPCIVSRADGNQQGAFTLRLGSILPVQSTATGHVFLAYLPREETQAVVAREREQRSEASCLADDEIEAVIAKVRADGVAATIGRLNSNFAGIAVPVFNADGTIAAALTLLGSTDYVVGERQDAFRASMLNAGTAISERIAAPQER